MKFKRNTYIPYLLLFNWLILISQPTFAASEHRSVSLKPKRVSKSNIARQRQKQRDFKYKWRKYTNPEIADLLGWVPSKDPCNACKGYYKESKTLIKYPIPLPPKQLPLQITAKGTTTFEENGVSVLRNRVVATQPGRIMTTDKAYIYRDEKTGKITRIRMLGHVHMQQHGKLIVAELADFNLINNTGYFVNAFYHLAESTVPALEIGKKFIYDAWGEAKYVLHDAKGVLRLRHATYTTCSPQHPVWQVKASYLILNKIKGVGKAYNAIFRIFKIPILYLPRYSFSLNHERKSGILGITQGYSKRNGYELDIPYYWNMAPNYDLQIDAYLMTKRNLQLNNYFRYLTEHSQGNLYLSFLFDDRAFNEFRKNSIAQFSGNPLYTPYVKELKKDSNNRGYFSFDNQSSFDSDWSSDIHLNYVTDSYYFNDFQTKYSEIQANQLLNYADLKYSGTHWQFLGFFEAYQTLHPLQEVVPGSIGTNQYTRLPEFDIDGQYPNFFKDLDFQVSAQAVNFLYHSNFPPLLTFQRPVGQRFHMMATITRPFTFTSGYITPLLALDNTDYFAQLAAPAANISRPTFKAGRNIPIFNVDSGLYFDRAFHFNHHDYTQTLEPRLFYLYIPLENQNKFPVFDSQFLPFSFDQLFALNRFTGFDRVENANQMTFALTTRILDNQNGMQKLNAGIGIIYYFTKPQVTIPNLTSPSQQVGPVNQRMSPLVGEITYYPSAYWSTSGSFAWNTKKNTLSNATTNIAFSKAGKYVASVGYQFVRSDGAPFDSLGLSNNTHLIDVALVWPVNNEWSLLGNWYYNIAQRRMQNYLAGIQYSTCCWAIRFMVYSAFNHTNPDSTIGHITNKFNTTVYIQLLLKGLGNFGNNNANGLIASTFGGFQDPFNIEHN